MVPLRGVMLGGPMGVVWERAMGTTSADRRRLEGAVARFWMAIDARQDAFAALVAALVRHPSPLGYEAVAQAYVPHTR